VRSRRTAIVFTILAIGFAVIDAIAVVLSRRGVLPFSMEHADFWRASVPGTIIWAVFSNFGPALAAVLALALCQGRGAVADLGRSLVRWRVPGRLYVLAWFGILINIAVVIAGYAVHALHFDPTGFSPVKFIVLYFAMIALDGPLGEEIGWRGVLLRQLLRTMSPLAASVVVGVVWYLWHVPSYLTEGKLPGAFEHVFFLYTCIALAIIYTWFFLKSNGSTLLMIYLHQASNYSTFLRAKLFPKTSPSIVPFLAYGAVLLGIALFAARAIARERSLLDARSANAV